MMREPSGIVLAGEAVRVAAAVPALVLVADEHARTPARNSTGREDLLADDRVALDLARAPRRSSGPRLSRIASGTAILPMSWKTAPKRRSRSSRVVHPEPAADRLGVLDDRAGVVRRCRSPWPRARRRAPRRCPGRRARAARRASAERSAEPTWSAIVSTSRTSSSSKASASSSSTFRAPQSSPPTYSGHDELGAHRRGSRPWAVVGLGVDVVGRARRGASRRQRPISPASRGWRPALRRERGGRRRRGRRRDSTWPSGRSRTAAQQK